MLLDDKCYYRNMIFILERQLLRAVSFRYKILDRNFSSTFSLAVGYKLKDNIKDCYSLLKVTEESSMEEVKGAYFKLAKIYHPDSASTTADPRKFEQVKEAYKSIKAHRTELADTRIFYGVDDDDDDDEGFDVSKLQPQHRPYLENQGIGHGTPSQRRKQYDQHRVSRVVSDISKYRIKKIVSTGESSLVAKDKKAARRAKISNSMDRLVEDLIQESMSRGEFDNLSGFGKPLDVNQASPYTDKITEKLNDIMKDSGVQPEWIALHKEIRMGIQESREKFAIEKKLLGEGPYSEELEARLKYHADKLRKAVDDINVKIKKFNLLVPILTKQMMPYDYNKEYVNIFKNPDKYLPYDFDLNFHRKIRGVRLSGISSEESGWKGVWDDFKSIFRASKDG